MYKSAINISVSCILLLVISLLNGCEQKKEPLRVALLEWPPYELAFWAYENNWFTNENAVLLEYKTPAEVTRAFTTGAVDIVAVTSDFALTLMEQNPDTRIFIVIDASNGGDTVLSKSPMDRQSNFKGKTIGVESGPLGSFMLARFMDKFAIERAELTIKYVDIPGQEEMWDQDQLDLLITYDPIRSKLKAKGAHEIFTSKEIPNEIIDVFLIRETKLESQKENLKAFITGWFKAVSDLHENKSSLFSFIGQRENLPAGTVQSIFKEVYVPGYAENMAQLSGKNIEFLSGLELHEKIMIEKKLMKRSVDKSKLVTNEGLLLIENQ